MKLVAEFQEAVSSFYKNNRKNIHLAIGLKVLLLYFAFLIYGLVTHWDKTFPLLIMTVVVAVGLFYFKFLKPHYGERFEQRIWNPIELAFVKIWSLRLVKWYCHIRIKTT